MDGSRECLAPSAAVMDADLVLGDTARHIAAGLKRPSLSAGILATIAVLMDCAALGIGFWFAVFAAAPAPVDGASIGLIAALVAVLAVALTRAAGGYRVRAPEIGRRILRKRGLIPRAENAPPGIQG